jgi:hypothetical protein
VTHDLQTSRQQLHYKHNKLTHPRQKINVLIYEHQQLLQTVKGKAIPLQALTGPEGSRVLRLPDFKTIGTQRWQGCQPYAPAAFTPKKYSCYRLSRPQGHSVTGRIMSMKNSDTIGYQSRDLPVCSAVPQPLRHRGEMEWKWSKPVSRQQL